MTGLFQTGPFLRERFIGDQAVRSRVPMGQGPFACRSAGGEG